MSAPRHLLAVNFRDPGHPEAGGAELHLEEILLEAVRQGWRVTWLVSGFVNGAPEAEHRGMRIVRRGDWWNFNMIVPGVLRREFSGANTPDLVVEDINKVPCFVAQHTSAPVAVIVPHLFGTTAFQEANALIASYVVMLEKLIPAAYARSRFLAISESTRDDLVARGVSAGRVSVVHCGLDHERYQVNPAVAKTPHPSLVYVGRLRRYKGLDWVIRTLPRLRSRAPGLRLSVIGDGPWQGELVKQAAACGVSDLVDFRGFLPAREKLPLLQSAWALVQPSPKEGWGLTVVEAGACGTAVVAADSPGLRDSVCRDQTGLLVPYGDDDALADALARVLGDTALRERLATAGVQWASGFRWDDCARRSLAVLTGER
ncbi:MAG: glycosyltransferase family 4 protein [Candidatus Eisenbacteria bacterium]|uniref:Glycosyltransferase family 4 protein n=1 Tax=Eiseniibacteriota bacterium TaxID=2212470 RepID=A0A933W7U0_UNCEI|nr:glycosyltransferase family 4 protein [Candidatus Eisenbacteria bacterium]